MADPQTSAKLFPDKYIDKLMTAETLEQFCKDLFGKGLAISRIVVPSATTGQRFRSVWEAVAPPEYWAGVFDLSPKPARIYPRRRKRRLSYVRYRG